MSSKYANATAPAIPVQSYQDGNSNNNEENIPTAVAVEIVPEANTTGVVHPPTNPNVTPTSGTASAQPVQASINGGAAQFQFQDVEIRDDMGRYPVHLTHCPFCGGSGQTKTKDEFDGLTWVYIIIMFCTGLWCFGKYI